MLKINPEVSVVSLSTVVLLTHAKFVLDWMASLIL